jgi:hypothetical protein
LLTTAKQFSAAYLRTLELNGLTPGWSPANALDILKNPEMSWNRLVRLSDLATKHPNYDGVAGSEQNIGRNAGALIADPRYPVFLKLIENFDSARFSSDLDLSQREDLLRTGISRLARDSRVDIDNLWRDGNPIISHLRRLKQRTSVPECNKR